MLSKPSAKQSRRSSEYERPIVYDREIFIEICRRLLLGQDPLAICEKPPMPTRPGFLGWIQDHKEAREIHRSMNNFGSDRALASKLGTPLLVGIGEWEELVRANCERGWPADYIDRGYLPPDWSKVFPVIGGPPASSAENLQAYNDLLNGFTQMLEPRDLMELIWTKQATDATWDGIEEDEEKNAVLSLAQMATGRDLRRVFDAGFNYCRSTQLAQSRLMRRRDNAVRQLERWRKGLGAKSRRLPDQFLDEQVLAQRYRDQVQTVPDNDVTAPEPAEVAPAEAAEAMISASPLLAPSGPVKSVARPAPADGAMHVAPPTASSGEVIDAVARPAPADPAMHVAPPIAAAGDTIDAVAPTAVAGGVTHVAPPIASSGEAVDAVALTPPADAAMHVAPPTASSEEAHEAVPRLTVPPPAPADEPGQAPPPLLATPSDKAAKAALPDGSQRWAA